MARGRCPREPFETALLPITSGDRSMRLALFLSLCALTASCTSTQMVGYADGTVKSSTLTHRFEAPPLLTPGSGSYAVHVEGAQASADVRSLSKNGMRRVAPGAGPDVSVTLALGEVRQGEAGAMKLGQKWYPAFEVSVPYEVSIRGADGSSLGADEDRHSEHLTFRGVPGFATREEAVGAIEAVRQLAMKGVEEKARINAVGDAAKKADKLAASLFRQREIAMDVPVVRAAAGVDMEEAYTLLSEGQHAAALERYEASGQQHMTPEGQANGTANYGVACGVAACKLLMGDGAGPWQWCSVALGFEPEGGEAQELRRIIYQEECASGERVIPADERAEIDAQMETANRLQDLFRR